MYSRRQSGLSLLGVHLLLQIVTWYTTSSYIYITEDNHAGLSLFRVNLIPSVLCLHPGFVFSEVIYHIITSFNLDEEIFSDGILLGGFLCNDFSSPMLLCVKSYFLIGSSFRWILLELIFFFR